MFFFLRIYVGNFEGFARKEHQALRSRDKRLQTVEKYNTVLLCGVYDVPPFKIQIKLLQMWLAGPTVASSMYFTFVGEVLTFAFQSEWIPASEEEGYAFKN